MAEFLWLQLSNYFVYVKFIALDRSFQSSLTICMCPLYFNCCYNSYSATFMEIQYIGINRYLHSFPTVTTKPTFCHPKRNGVVNNSLQSQEICHGRQSVNLQQLIVITNNACSFFKTCAQLSILRHLRGRQLCISAPTQA